MSTYKNLKPCVHTFKLVGGTGDGKTKFAITSAEIGAREILRKCVGGTNSTLKEKLFVYTEELTDKIIVATKPNDDIFDRSLFVDMLSQALAKVIKKFFINKYEHNLKEEEKELKRYLCDEINTEDNTRAILSLLTNEKKNKFIESIVFIYYNYKLYTDNFNIYNTVKKNFMHSEIGENSAKFLNAIKTEVERRLDSFDIEVKDKLWNIWGDVNSQLKDIFFIYFNNNCISGDGYYYKEILLDSSIENTSFINAMFSSNDIQGLEGLSLEMLCKEIVIYSPLCKNVADIINKNSTSSKVFRNNKGKITFAILDTRGLYHIDDTGIENKDYVNDLLYSDDVDALLLVIPMMGDSNEKKIKKLYKEALRGFNKQIPVFIIHNKLDLFVSELNKGFDDPFIDIKDKNDLSVDEIIEEINKKKVKLQEEFQKVQSNARKYLTIESIPCYLTGRETLQPELRNKFSVANVFEQIFGYTARHLYMTDNYIPLKVNNLEYDNVSIEINKKYLVKTIIEYIKKDTVNNEVFEPGMENLKSNIDKTPHGQGYNALRRRLMIGRGYDSHIKESYYYNCEPFSISFPENLNKFISYDLLNKISDQVITIHGGNFINSEDRIKFFEIVKRNIHLRAWEFVKYLLYDKAMLEAEKTSFSFRAKFQSFLKNSEQYFNKKLINPQVFISAIAWIIDSVAWYTLQINVTFR